MSVVHRHHIVPKHLGGSDDPSNIAFLSVEGHAEAHRILFEKFGRWEDELAWKGLSGLMSKADIVREVQSRAAKDSIAKKGNPWSGKRTSMNWLENPDNHQKALKIAASPSVKQKRVKTMAANGHQQGSKNSKYGKSLYVNEQGLRKYFLRGSEPTGWRLRSIVLEESKNKFGAYGRSWYNDGKKNYFLMRDDPLVTEMKLEKRRITA